MPLYIDELPDSFAAAFALCGKALPLDVGRAFLLLNEEQFEAYDKFTYTMGGIQGVLK